MEIFNLLISILKLSFGGGGGGLFHLSNCVDTCTGSKLEVETSLTSQTRHTW